jgi:UDP-glucose 4-epimerase
VVDLAKAHVRALEFLVRQKEEIFYEVFNVGTGQGVSVLELINTFISVTGVDLPYEIGARRPGDVEKVYADPAKVTNTLQWSAGYSLAESLQHAWLWERKVRGLKN